MVGSAIPDWREAKTGFDVVILKRGGTNEPGPEVLDAPGHVGFYAGAEADPMRGAEGYILLLAGNQSDQVNVSRFPMSQILGIRRLYD